MNSVVLWFLIVLWNGNVDGVQLTGTLRARYFESRESCRQAGLRVVGNAPFTQLIEAGVRVEASCHSERVEAAADLPAP